MVNSAEPRPDGDKQKNTLDIGLLEEDDEFEEFPVEGNVKHLFQPQIVVTALTIDNLLDFAFRMDQP